MSLYKCNNIHVSVSSCLCRPEGSAVTDMLVVEEPESEIRVIPSYREAILQSGVSHTRRWQVGQHLIS